MRIRKKRIRTVVEHLLTQNAITAAPVPLEVLTQAVGADVRRTPADAHLSGFLLRGSGTRRVIIGVNREQHPNRQRFTIAHELGHLLLHAGQDIYVDECSATGLKISLRDEKATIGTQPEEIEANLFAAELLMPVTFLQHDLAAYGPLDFLDDEERLNEVLTALAKQYEVSKQALTYRLVNLEYVHL